MPDDRRKSWEDFGFLEAVLARNLEALSATEPETAALLRASGVHARLTLTSENGDRPRVAKQIRRAWVRIEESDAECLQAAPTIRLGRVAEPLILVGLGTGERLAHDLEALPARRTILAYEPDPSLAVLALSRRDFSRPISNGRLRIVVGGDLAHLDFGAFGEATLHPRLAPLHKDLWARLVASSEAAPYAVPAARPRAVVIEGELLEREIAGALGRKGFDVWTLAPAELSREQFTRDLRLIAPTHVFSVNFDPDVADIAADLDIDYVAYEIDPTASALVPLARASRTTERTHVFTYRKSRVRLFAAAGYEQVEHMLIAADPETRRPPADSVAKTSDVVFVGSCMKKNAAKLMSLLAASLGRDPAIRDRFVAFLLAVRKLEDAIAASPCLQGVESMLAELLSRFGLPQTVLVDGRPADLVVMVGESLAATKRSALARRFAADPNFRVFGDDDWMKEVPPLTYCGPVAHGEPLTRLYAHAGVVIDMNRCYQPDIVTLRVFEALASGAFVIAEASEDLGRAFEIGREMVAYESPEEALALIDRFRTRPRERDAIVRAGRERLLRDHTIDARVAAMLERVAERNAVKA